MSVKRNVRRVSAFPRSSFTRSSSSFAPSRSKVASAASSSVVDACSCPDAGRRCRAAAAPARSRTARRRAAIRPVHDAGTGRGRPVSLGELELAEGVVNGGVEGLGAAITDLVRVDDALELVRGGARGLRVGSGDRDLDLSRQAPQARQGILHLFERARDPRERGVDLALRQAQQRKTGLRVTPQLVRGAIRLFRSREVAPPTTDLADLVVAGRGDVALEVVELLARGHRLSFRCRPVAAQAHDLRAMEAAGPRKPADVEAVAPAVRRLGPLGGAPVVADVVARADRHAVDEPGGIGPQLAGEAARSLRRAARAPPRRRPVNEHASLADEGQRLRVSVVEPLARSRTRGRSPGPPLGRSPSAKRALRRA